MNREILYRGKRVDNSEWVYGNHDKVEKLDKSGEEFFIIEYPADGKSYEIIPETVGEYTGLTDKNGKKIFEGDIVKHSNTTFEVAYITQYARFAGRKPKTIMSIFPLEKSEVIGNIHDAPELLEGSGE